MLGWCGFTFVHGMTNSEMIIAANYQGSTGVSLHNFYSFGNEAPTQNNGISGWVITGSSTTSGIFINFTRPLTTGVSNDKVLSVGLSTPFSYAYYLENTNGVVPHDKAIQGDIVFGATTQTSKFSSNSGLLLTLRGVFLAGILLAY